jgi:hypothetical protein
VAGVVADARVEDVLQTMFPEEEVADDAHGATVRWVCPQSPQVRDCVYSPLLLLQKGEEVGEV